MRRASVLLLAALVMTSVAPAVAKVDGGEVQRAQRRLERITRNLEEEGEGLERLASGPQLAGADGVMRLERELARVEVRLSQQRVEASRAIGLLLSAAVVGRLSTAPHNQIPGLGLTATTGRELAVLSPVLDDWAAYRLALGRVVGLCSRLRSLRGGEAEGLVPAGRTCPVDGPHRFEPTWGEERPWGREHKGEDLHASPGTPLVAMESGTIVQSGWHWSGGFGVYLEGHYSGDVYYYAHLMWTAPGIRPGVVVEVGDLLGWVGVTGNAESPHLHLGWIPGDAPEGVGLDGLADPYPLLVGLCG